MAVIISPQLKRTKVQIDANGNEVVPFTKQVIRPMEVPYIPEAKLAPQSPDNPLAEMIKKQVQEAVKESIKGIDISKMVSEAIKDAFKP